MHYQYAHLSFKTEIHFCMLLVDCSIYKYLLFQQKAKETPEKAEQPTETFNLGLWWRCRHVKYNMVTNGIWTKEWNQKVSKATGIFYGVD